MLETHISSRPDSTLCPLTGRPATPLPSPLSTVGRRQACMRLSRPEGLKKDRGRHPPLPFEYCVRILASSWILDEQRLHTLLPHLLDAPLLPPAMSRWPTAVVACLLPSRSPELPCCSPDGRFPCSTKSRRRQDCGRYPFIEVGTASGQVGLTAACGQPSGPRPPALTIQSRLHPTTTSKHGRRRPTYREHGMYTGAYMHAHAAIRHPSPTRASRSPQRLARAYIGGNLSG